MAAITLEELLKEVGVCPEKLNESISDDHLCQIALFLPSWCKVASYIGLSEMDINDAEQEGINEQDQTLKALQRWKENLVLKQHTGSWWRFCYHLLWQMLLRKYAAFCKVYISCVCMYVVTVRVFLSCVRFPWLVLTAKLF